MGQIVMATILIIRYTVCQQNERTIVNLKFGIRFHILDYLLIATDGLWHMQESRSRFRAFAQSVNFDSILTAFRISAILMGSK